MKLDSEIRRNRQGAAAIGLAILFIFGGTAVLSVIAHFLNLSPEGAGAMAMLATLAVSVWVIVRIGSP